MSDSPSNLETYLKTSGVLRRAQEARERHASESPVQASLAPATAEEVRALSRVREHFLLRLSRDIPSDYEDDQCIAACRSLIERVRVDDRPAEFSLTEFDLIALILSGLEGVPDDFSYNSRAVYRDFTIQ